MNILFIESNSIAVEGYISILGNEKYTFFKTKNSKEFSNLFKKTKDLDLAIVNCDSSGFSEKEFDSCFDCIAYIQMNIPYCKIVIITNNEKALVLYNLYKTIKADALLVKSDFTKELLLNLVESNNDTFPYLSALVKEAIQTIIKNDSLLDSKNRRIIALLSQGLRVNQLCDEVLLSRSAVQKRVSKMLVAFDVKDCQELLAVLRAGKII